MKPLKTIGHSSLEPEIFVQILKKFDIEILADVRSVPYSRFASAFNKEPLAKFLHANDIRYIYIGDLLGGRFEPKFFDRNGELDTQKLFTSDKFSAGIKQILDLATNFNVCLMCAEQDPLKCHRFGVISQFLSLNFRDVEVSHIVPSSNSQIFTLAFQKELEAKILDKFCGESRLNLYDENDELASAYAGLNKALGYKRADI
ncbi:DUF488 domain-containing protein [Campylobacter sp.]|uniref:DUF488 domain-containing protein n=1 Tax=Campylobacter sp. TaxID=205 RepID=UPI0026FCCEFF|nr:DUF488 domain-containing protein [Campylobacter sp.]